jgi:hypothetical protein
MSELTTLNLPAAGAELLKRIADLEHWYEASTVRELPPTATALEITNALLTDAASARRQAEEMEHLVGNVASWAEEHLSELENPVVLATRGQKVRCVDARRVRDTLSEGDDYVVEFFYPDFPRKGPSYCVVCDDGVERVYPVTRFETIPPEPSPQPE